MKTFEFSLRKSFYVFAILYIIYLLVSWSLPIEFAKYVCLSFLFGFLMFIFIVPIFQYSHFIIDNQNKRLIFKRERFLVRKKHKEFHFNSLDYRYIDEYTGNFSKNKVFSVFVNKKRDVKIIAQLYGQKQVDNFVEELDKVIYEYKNKIMFNEEK